MKKIIIMLSLFSAISLSHELNTFIEAKMGYDGTNEMVNTFGSRVSLSFGKIKGFSEIALRDLNFNKKNFDVKDYVKFYNEYEISHNILPKLEFKGKITTNISKTGYTYTIDPDFKYSISNDITLNIATVLQGNGNSKTNVFNPELRLGFDYNGAYIKNYFDFSIKKEIDSDHNYSSSINYYIRNYKKNKALKDSNHTERTLNNVIEDKDSIKKSRFHATYKLDNEFKYEKNNIFFKNISDFDYLDKDFRYYTNSIPNKENETVFLTTPDEENSIKVPYNHKIKRTENTLTFLNKSEFKYKLNTNVSLNLLGETKTTVKRSGTEKLTKYHYWYIEDENFSKETYEQKVKVDETKLLTQNFKIEPQLHYSKTINSKNSITFTPSLAFEFEYKQNEVVNEINIQDTQVNSLQFKYTNKEITNRKLNYWILPKVVAKYTATINDKLSVVFEPELVLSFNGRNEKVGFVENSIGKLELKNKQETFENLITETKDNYRERYSYFYDANKVKDSYLDSISNEENLKQLNEKGYIRKNLQENISNKNLEYSGTKLKAKLSLIYKW